MDLENRYEKGIKITYDSIKNGDAKKLLECVKQFRKINTPAEIIFKALEECPISLIDQAGIEIKVHSSLLNSEISIGKDITWGEAAILVENQTGKEEIEKILEVKSVFEGKLTGIERSDEYYYDEF